MKPLLYRGLTLAFECGCFFGSHYNENDLLAFVPLSNMIL